MSWSDWNHHHSYRRPEKRRFDEINNTIEHLRHELLSNDFFLRKELEWRIVSDFDRELIAADLFKERLLALTMSSRSQVMFIQTGALDRRNYDDDFTEDVEFSSRSPKRKKCNHNNDFNHNYHHQPNDWNGRHRGSYHKNNRKTQYKQRRPHRRPSTTINHGNNLRPVPCTTTINTTNSGLIIPKTVPLSSNIMSKMAPNMAKSLPVCTNLPKMTPNIVKSYSNHINMHQSAPVSKVNTQTNFNIKPNIANRPNNSNIAVQTFSATTSKSVSTNTSNTAMQMTSSRVKLENSTKTVPSLFSINLEQVKLQFSEANKVTVKSETNFVKVKTEFNDSMHDDLENHL